MAAMDWLACSGLAVVLSTLSAVVITHAWVGLASQRYILPVLVLPLALGTIVVGPSLSRWMGAWARAAELTLLLLLVLVARKVEAHTPRGQGMMLLPGRACADTYLAEENLEAGYAQYWHARPLMVLGKSKVTLAQVQARLQPYPWASNTFWSTRGYWSRPGRPRFAFVLTARLDEHWIETRFGVPRAKHPCFGSKIWVYDRPEDFEFRNYVRSEAALATGDDASWWQAEGGVAGAYSADNGGNENRLAFRLPLVRANVIEIVSPTRRELELSYQRNGVVVAQQEVTFPNDEKRLLALPATLDAAGADGLLITAKPGVHFRVKRVALMSDPEVEGVRPSPVSNTYPLQ